MLCSAGYYPFRRARPEIETVNYVPRVHTPTLMLNGKYDTLFPYATSQRPFFDALGTRDKQLVLSDNGHIVSVGEAIPASLAWLDRYLGAR